MNKTRRKQIDEAITDLNKLIECVTTIGDEESEAYESMIESLQNSERGEQSEAAISGFEQALEDLESASCSLEEAKG